MNLFYRLKQYLASHVNDVLPIALLAGFPFIYFWQATLRQAVFFFGDIFLFFYPTHQAYADALRAGRLPLWEPRMLAGFPLYAEGQIGALYPTHPFLYGLLPIDVATNYDILINLAWVAVGMYLFMRALNLRPASAFLAGVAFSFGGFFIVRLQHMSVLATAAWLPWTLWAWEKHEQEKDAKKRWRWLAVLAIFSGIQLLGGHPQFAFMSVILLALYAMVNWQRGGTLENEIAPLAWLAKLQASVARRVPIVFEYVTLTRVILVVLAVGVGAAIAAMQLLPTYELSTISNRAAGLLPKFFNAYSLRLPHYLMLLYPFLLGNPYPRVSVEVVGYIGLLPLVLAFAAPLVRRDRRVVFFLLIALVALFLGLGDQNVFYRGLRYLPLFNYFRVPSRFFFWYTFAATILAAYTFDYLLARAHVTATVTRGQKIALALVVLVLAAIIGIIPAVPLETWLALWVWLPLALALIAAWILLGARRGLFTRTTLTALGVGVVMIDLALFESVYTKTYDSMTTVADFYTPPSTLAYLKNLSPENGRALTSLWIYPWMVTMRESLYPNVTLAYNIPSAIGYTPLLPQAMSEYLEVLDAPLMNLLNVRYYLMPQMLPVDAKTEGDDVNDGFAPDWNRHDIAIPPTLATNLIVTSSLAQSVDLRDGDVVAQIGLLAQDGTWFTVPLRAGYDTAEWAYDRTDVLKVIKHARPTIATTFDARSAFPTEAHPGHTYRAQFDITRNGKPLAITDVMVMPTLAPGLVHIETMALVQPNGSSVSLAALSGHSDQQLIYRTNEVAVFENQNTLPRAFLVHDTQIADDDATIKVIGKEQFKPAQLLFLDGGQALNAGGAQRADESVRIVNYQPEHVVLTVDAKADGYVLLADAWAPSWVARVDGVETPIQRGDLIFRAVKVSPGTHQIEFDYRPLWLYVGAAISGLALVLIGAALWWTRKI